MRSGRQADHQKESSRRPIYPKRLVSEYCLMLLAIRAAMYSKGGQKDKEATRAEHRLILLDASPGGRSFVLEVDVGGRTLIVPAGVW